MFKRKGKKPSSNSGEESWNQCPICFLPFKDPVLSPCGHTFCKRCIMQCLAQKKQCPIDRAKLSSRDLVPNAAILQSGTRRRKLSREHSFDMGEDEPDPVVFAEEISPSMICPIHQGVVQDPLQSGTCDHTFCSRCILSVIDNSDDPSNVHCPLDSKPIVKNKLFPNRAITEMMNDLKVHCKYGCKLSKKTQKWKHDKKGCPEIVTRDTRHEHERDCPYRTVPCPNARNPSSDPEVACGKYPAKDLELHLEKCTRAICPHRHFGCMFVGTVSDLKNHMAEYGYIHMRDQLRFFENQLEDMRGLMGSLGARVQYLEARESAREGGWWKSVLCFLPWCREGEAVSEDEDTAHSHSESIGAAGIGRQLSSVRE